MIALDADQPHLHAPRVATFNVTYYQAFFILIIGDRQCRASSYSLPCHYSNSVAVTQYVFTAVTTNTRPLARTKCHVPLFTNAGRQWPIAA